MGEKPMVMALSLHGCASYKRFFFINGIIGFILVSILYWSLFYKYRSNQTWGFLVLYVICNMIRDYPFRLMWLYLFILGSVILSLPPSAITSAKVNSPDTD